MSEEQLKELQEYNLEYLEAQASEEMFGGDFTSAVELKQAKKEIERLNNIIKTKDEGIKAFVEDLCETTEELEKANNKIKMALDYIQNAKGKDINYVATLLLGYPIEISEMCEQFLEAIGRDKE